MSLKNYYRMSISKVKLPHVNISSNILHLLLQLPLGIEHAIELHYLEENFVSKCHLQKNHKCSTSVVWIGSAR